MEGVWTYKKFRDGSEAGERHNELAEALTFAKEEAECENIEFVSVRVNGFRVEHFKGFFAT